MQHEQGSKDQGTNSKRLRVQVMEVKTNDHGAGVMTPVMNGSSFQPCDVTCNISAIEETTGDEEND